MAPPKRALASSSSSRRPHSSQPAATQPGIQRFFFNSRNGGGGGGGCTILSHANGGRGDKDVPVSSLPAAGSLCPTRSPPLLPPPEAGMTTPGDEKHQEKRMRISPGMMIMQSQDDGAGDQVEWKLSPTAERLQEVHHVSTLSSNSLMRPNMNQIIRSSDGSNVAPVVANPTKRRSPSLAGKLEKWLSTSEATPVMKEGVPKDTTIKSCDLSEKQTPALRDKENDATAINLSVLETDSSLLKPPRNSGGSILSSTSRHTLVTKSQKKKGSKQRGSGKRRKALLELLDQVQNVISDPEPVSTQCHIDIDTEDREKAETKATESGMEDMGLELDETTSEIPLEVSLSYQQMTAIKELNPRICSQEETIDVDSGIMKGNTDGDIAQVKHDQMMASDNIITIPKALANIHFLVLEVADIAEPSGSYNSHVKVLRLLNEYSGVERVLYLADEWFFTVVRPGDTVNVIGDFVNGKCRIDQRNNLLVVHPDVLIAGSKVGSSFNCSRRAVLDERIRSNSVSFPALLGTMMHELFQQGLINKSTTKLVLEHEAESIVGRHINSLYACGGDEKDALSKLKDCIPTILNWLTCFLHASTTAMPKVDFGRKEGQLSMSVAEVIDIEEMIYSPKFGLKGMVDASLLVKFDNLGLSEQRILPLEFKSGKLTTGQAALEHRAQVILYSLLMSDRYLEPVNNGLLFYLQTNQTQGVGIQHADLVGLVMRRNELATNLLNASSTQQLPPMIQNMHACQRCWHVDTCSIYHKAQEGGTAESSGLGNLFNEKTEHLEESHSEFLKLWDRLIDLEAQELQASQSEIWRLPAQEREAAGRCLSSMCVKMQPDGTCEERNQIGNFIYNFIVDTSRTSSGKDRSQLKGLHEKSFACGDHVLLSTENGHVAVASGSIYCITEDYVSIKLSHQLRLPGEQGVSNKDVLLQQVWRIDKDESASFLGSMRFNVLQLFLKGDGHDQSRRLIVDLEKPRFDGGGFFSQDPAAAYVRSASDLNDDQQRAIFKILSARDYALVLGMPGTGKTSTIVHAVKALLTRGASILLTSYTNSAVDNILLKLKQEDVDFVRLGRETAIHQDLKEYVIEGLNISSVEQLDERMRNVNVVAATCLGVTHPLLTNRKFDVCIVDEAGQITLPVCLGPLHLANSFVLVGDHYQLPPLVRNAEAREKGLSVSLFRRLSEAHPQAIAALQSQYRMNAGIMSLCNTLIYGNRLRCGSSKVANAQLAISDAVSCRGPVWLQEVIDATKPAIFINTDMLINKETHRRNSTHSTIEASIVIMIIKRMLEGGIDGKDIGVISPYNYQVQHIRRLLTSDDLDMLEVHTIDRYQGRDKDCILVSFVKSTCKGSSQSTLLADWHRINVAITRAKKKLILIGSRRTLSTTPVLKLLINEVEQAGGLVNLSEDLKLLTGTLTSCKALDVGKHRG